MKKNYTIVVALLFLSSQLLTAQRNGRMLFTARLSGANEVPANTSKAKGLVTAVVVGNEVTINAVFDSLSGPVTGCHFHKAVAAATGGTFTNFLTSVRGNRLYIKTTLTNAQIGDMMEDSVYFNVHTAANTGGEIRGQMLFETDYLMAGIATGGQEVPVTTSPATAVGAFSFSRLGNRLDYKIVANGLTGAITSAHIHYGSLGRAGAVILPLAYDGNVLSGSLALTPPIVDSLINGKVYFNIHTAANGGGEIRGQVDYQGDGVAFDGFIDGTQEVPTNASTAKGVIAALIRPNLDTIDYLIQVSGTNFAPSSAHFHGGIPGVSGGVLVTLTPLGVAYPNLYLGKAGLTPSLLSGFLKDSIYANFHTSAFAGGEIRGQVTSLTRTSLVANLCGGQETPAVVTNAAGASYISLARDKSNLYLDAVTTGLSTDATGAHIHKGAKGIAGPVSINLTTALVGNAVRGSLSTLAVGLADSIANGLSYINFHTTANPNGEIRGQEQADLVQECLANGVFELNGTQTIVKIAPNPVSERLNITFDSQDNFDAQIVVSDLAGRQMSSKTVNILRGSNALDVSMSNMSNGIYFIQMRQANRLIFTEKVVKN